MPASTTRPASGCPDREWRRRRNTPGRALAGPQLPAPVPLATGVHAGRRDRRGAQRDRHPAAHQVDDRRRDQPRPPRPAAAARRGRGRPRRAAGRCSTSSAAGCRPTRSPGWTRPSAATSTRTCSGCRPAFHDAWQSGQLLSRATNDLSAIRRFAGFGIVFLITNTITFIAVIGLLIRLNWWLGLLTGTVFVPVVWASTKFQRRYRVLSRRSQDQQGDLATYVEEAATGIRVLKALGRGGEAATQHAGQAAEVFGTELAKARLRSTFWAGLDLIPNAMIGALLLLGAHRRRPARADPGRPGRVHHADPDAALADRVDGLHPGRRAGGGHRRAAHLRDPGHRAVDPEPHPAQWPGPDGAAARPPRPPRVRPGRVPLPGGGARPTARRIADR